MNTATIIAQEVARATGVSITEILSGRRDARTVVARHMCAVLMRDVTPWGTPAIARALKLYDHTTILHALKTWPIRLQKNPLAARIGVARAAIDRRLAKQRAAARIVDEASGHVVL